MRLGLMAPVVGILPACKEDITTSVDGDLIPVEAVTVEVDLPFQAFAEDLQGWSGYGQAYELSTDIVARSFEGTLDSRVLNGWTPYPTVATVRDSTGVFVTDSTLTYVGGQVVARFDTLTSVLEDPADLALGFVPRSWDFRSATWEFAVDSVGDEQTWPEAGAGPVTPLATAVWDPADGDTVVFELDSAAVQLMADSVDAAQGVRLEALTDGVRLDLVGLSYRLSVRPSVNPDSLVNLSVNSLARTFVYQPAPDTPVNEVRIGGVPAWRAVFTMDLPETLDGPPSLCQQVECPLALTPESLISASLVLTTQAVPAAFVPRDTLRLDVRPVFEPARLPKSPLGSSLTGVLGIQLLPEQFGEESGTEVEIPLGAYIESVLSMNAGSETEVPLTLALLSAFEPLSLYFAAFQGPDSPAPPRLNLILTLAEEVRIR
jgi:hypothetical protein